MPLPPETTHPALRILDVMVGTWHVHGRDAVTGAEVRGRVTFDWLDGGQFLVQRVEIDHAGLRITGTEYVGYDSESDSLRSYFFSDEGPGPFGGFALDSVWEVDESTVTIWGGSAGSPAIFTGEFSDDRTTLTGRWRWPGGGYEATMTRAGERAD